MLLRQLAAEPTDNISRKSRVLVGLENLRTHALPGALTKLLGTVVPENVAVASSFGAYIPQKLEHEEALYRVCQEALSNSLVHGKAQSVSVQLLRSKDLCLRVTDDGIGFEPAAARRDGHFGLAGMRERAGQIGADFQLRSRPGAGTVVEVVVP